MTKYNNDVSPDPVRGGNRAVYAKSDDYDFDGGANRRELSTSSMSQLQQQQLQQQPWRFVLLNYGSNHSQKPSKLSHGFTLNQPPASATQHRNVHSLVKKPPSSHATATQSNQNNANTNSDAFDENLDWINSSSNNNDDYDLMYDGNIPKTFSKYRFRRNSNPMRQTLSWQRY